VCSRDHREEQCQIPRQHPRDEHSELFGIERNILSKNKFGTQTIGEGFQHSVAKCHEQKTRTGPGNKKGKQQVLDAQINHMKYHSHANHQRTRCQTCSTF
jgi:hypothetical protein